MLTLHNLLEIIFTFHNLTFLSVEAKVLNRINNILRSIGGLLFQTVKF